ncbi:thiolase family protein [Arenibaculum sp.]|uniref:thiolase family protein n=1 Tax=Arenibaculum sp. TaxID=2865862 RepID=UPI002E14DC1A|nr:thiolase family protein [Arenibaculum sp.]
MSQHNDVVVAAFARTPFGRFGGVLADVSAPRLAALAIDALLDRSALSASEVEAVYMGVGMIAAATLTPARQAVLLSRLADTTPSLAVDRACCSGMSAIGIGWRDIRLGLAEVVICGGVDVLSATPLLWPRRRGGAVGPVTVADPLTLRTPTVDVPIAAYTSQEALSHGIDRAAQDAWALGSHQRYFAAEAAGYFDAERIAVEAPAAKGGTTRVVADESPRRDTSAEKLAALATVHGSLTITAGNAPGLNDGAAFLLLVSRRFAEERGLPVLARISHYAQVADGPTSGSYTPAIGIAKLLRAADRTARDLDLIEINEAFAATPLVSTLRLADGDAAAADRLRARTNRHGGAVAIGHPLGASGARVAMTLVSALRQRGGGFGAAAICGGFGQGDALLVDVP